MLVEPFILNRHGDGYAEARAHSIDEPAPTANCDGGGYVIEPMIVNMKGQSTASDVDAPLPTQTSHAAHIYVAEPFVLSRHGDGAPRSTDEPTPTQVAKHSHCLISPYYGSGSGETCQKTEEPLPTVTSKGRFGMVAPVTHADGSNRARDVENDPLPTLTTANRGEQALIEGTAQYDILFRILEPHELAAAMGFDDEESAYEFAGTKTEKIKQIGNAVSVAKMKACVSTIMADAAAQTFSRIEAAE